MAIEPLTTEPPPTVALEPASPSPDRRPPGDAAPPWGPAIATAVCLAATVGGWLLGVDTNAGQASFALAYVAGGIYPLRQAIAALRERQLSVDSLMLLAAAGAALVKGWTEGAILLFLFTLSGALEAFAVYRTTRTIESLVQLRPREAHRERDGLEERVPVEDLAIGDLVRLRPGERIPVDGELVEGETWADEATITGESEPVHKLPGSPVFAGTVNTQGTALVRMTRAVADTTLERIVAMVREAQAQKTPGQVLIETWERPYVLSVLGLSALVFLAAWQLAGLHPADAFYRAMVVLVVASPCAVVVGTPAVMLSAIARAGRQGVLFKGAVYLDRLGAVDVMAFDKTGTITRGRPAVTAVWTPSGSADDEAKILRLAAVVERRSEHPLAKTVVAEARRRGLDVDSVDPTAFESHTGLGVHARVDDLWVGIGRDQLFADHSHRVPPEAEAAVTRFRDEGQTALLVVTSDGLTGVVALADEVRPESAEALASLKRLGVRELVILTGDHERVARAIARRVGADDVRAGLLPDQKVAELQRLETGGRHLAMVGDGVNDAPALAAAGVGIAMGGAGTDVALEVADVVLMRDDLRGLPFAVGLSRAARRRVRQNLAFAFGMIAILLIVSWFGLPLWTGVLGHEGSTVAVVLNGLRMLWWRPREARLEAPRTGLASANRARVV